MIPKNHTRKQKDLLIHKIVCVGLIALVLLLGSLDIAKARGYFIPAQKHLVEGNIIHLSNMTLEQKIAQMVVVHGSSFNMDAWKKMSLGGIHLFAMEKEDLFSQVIGNHQEEMAIPFMVTVDLEGCLNPFAHFRNFTAASEIKDVGEAFQKGSDEGKFLKSLGFSINFAPVVDLEDQIWKCRSFSGNETSISEIAEAYILGLQSQGIVATLKHYPGKTLVVKDPHKFIVRASIDEKDIFPYYYMINKGAARMIMVTHVISEGAVDSAALPAVASPKAIQALKQNYAGLIVTDEINMLGLKNYFSSLDAMYIAVFKAGNDIVLNFNEDPNEIYRMIEVVTKAVQEGEIPERQIDESVIKILTLKGFKVEE